MFVSVVALAQDKVFPSISNVHVFASVVADDFVSLGAAKRPAAAAGIHDKGEKRKYLKVYEHLPSQWLSVYGEAEYHKASDPTVWNHMVEPQKSGAAWASEWCDADDNRRGTATNRWIMAVKTRLETELDPERKRQNEFVLNDVVCKQLYEEIDKIMPSLIYCLAPKKEFEKKGAAGMRCGVTQTVSEAKDPVELAKHGKILYEWLDTDQVSRIRMLFHWQGGGGQAYVASVYHRTAQIFRYFGNAHHEGVVGNEVSCEDFQKGIISRHKNGAVDEGMAAAASPTAAVNKDFS